ncbi:hypothetical protein A2U01_0102290, partial [Trifolium medium]|nr:hypothetical protein [Trifolium medium]
MVERSLSMRE